MRRKLFDSPVLIGTVHINTDQIPKYVGENIAQMALRAIQRDYADPAVQEDFQRWKAEKARKAAESDGNAEGANRT